MTKKKAKIWSWCAFFLIMCRVPILSGHPEWGFWALFLALMRGSAGDWPEMGQKGPKHCKSRHPCHCLGSEIHPRVPIQGGRVPILSGHPVCLGQMLIYKGWPFLVISSAFVLTWNHSFNRDSTKWASLSTFPTIFGPLFASKIALTENHRRDLCCMFVFCACVCVCVCVFFFWGFWVCLLIGKDTPTKIKHKSPKRRTRRKQEPNTQRVYCVSFDRKQYRKHSHFKKQTTKNTHTQKKKKQDPKSE